MNTEIDVQFAFTGNNLPTIEHFQHWIDTALSPYDKHFSLCIRIVDNKESHDLNNQYRGKDAPTNVLSFPFDVPEHARETVELLGDLVVCAPVVEQEAMAQNKQLLDHWAHMIVHGTLHLLGFDHINDEEAEEMEQLERDILAKLDITDPYLEI